MKPTQSNVWHKIPGWLVNEEADYLYSIVASLRKDDVFVEIGTYMGRSAAAIGLGCLQSGARLITVDHFLGNREHTVKPSLEAVHLWLERVDPSLRAAVTVVPEDGLVFAEQFTKPCHALFLDCEHTYKSTWDMYAAWHKWLVVGGSALFHDSANSGWDEVIRAVDDIARVYGLEYVKTADSIRHYRKKES